MAISKGLEVYVNGVDLSKAFKNAEYQLDRAMEDATTLDSTGSREYEAGLKTGSASFSGVWDADLTNADEIDDIMKAAYSAGSNVNVLAARAAFAAGEVCMMIESGLVENWALPVDVGGLLMASADIQSQNGIEHGKWLPKVNDSTAGTNGTSLDDTASSTGGLYFQAHAYELSDSANSDVDITLQHSANDSTWADLVALQSVGSAQGTVEGTIASGVTVNRYLRLVVQTTGGKGYVVGAFKRR